MAQKEVDVHSSAAAGIRFSSLSSCLSIDRFSLAIYTTKNASVVSILFYLLIVGNS